MARAGTNGAPEGHARSAARAAEARPGLPAARWGAAILVPCVLAAIFGGVSLWRDPAAAGWAPRIALPIALLTMALVAGWSVIRHTLEVRRLAFLLEEELVVSAASSSRANDLSALVATARTINGVLDLDEALPLLLDEALGFFGAGSGSIMLVDGAGFLQTVSSRGNQEATDVPGKPGHNVAEQVALTREPLLLEGTLTADQVPHLVGRAESVATVMCVPLIHAGELLGVLNVNGEERPFTEDDLQLAMALGAHASLAIANARAFASERDRLAQLVELNRRKSELIDVIGLDLSAAVAALAEDARRLGRVATDQRTRGVARSVEGHVGRLARSMDRLAGEEETRAAPQRGSGGSADLRGVATTAARDFESLGTPVDVEAPVPCWVRGDESMLQQVLWNLLDNAFKHGGPPVRIRVQTTSEAGVVSVLDAGPGIAPQDARRMSSGITAESSGVGLSIVHAIVSSVGGRVWAENGPERGAVFHVALPLAEPAAGEPSGVGA